MNEYEKKDEEIAREMREGSEPGSKEEGQAPRAASQGAEGHDQPTPRRLGAEATKVLQEFYEEAKARGPQKPLRDRMQVRVGHPTTR